MYNDLALAPDGKHVLVIRRDLQAINSVVWLMELPRAAGTQLTFLPMPLGAPVWSPDSSRIVFASLREGSLACI